MIDRDQILKIATLGRLEISENEAVAYSKQLAQALDYFQQIQKISVDGIAPLISPLEGEMFLREDQVHKEFTAEQLLSNAPEKSGHLFKVPPAVEEK